MIERAGGLPLPLAMFLVVQRQCGTAKIGNLEVCNGTWQGQE
jgi:hypothetical protein